MTQQCKNQKLQNFNLVNCKFSCKKSKQASKRTKIEKENSQKKQTKKK